MNKLIHYCSDNVKDVYRERGPFMYKKHEMLDRRSEKSLQSKGIKEVEPRTYYLGQWNTRGKKEGRGVLIKDGSIYEGFWKDNLENGVGRFINQQGDVYQG